MKKYVRESIARFRQFSIEKKLKWLRMVVIIPALVGIITLLVIMINFNESYNEAVKNVSVASKFNFSFSEDMDYKMYRIVIGAESFAYIQIIRICFYTSQNSMILRTAF